MLPRSSILPTLAVVLLLAGSRCYAINNCTANTFQPCCIDLSLAATFEDIEALPEHPDELLIDVRNTTEIQASGSIPTSINIPLYSLTQALQLSPEQFQVTYGRPKPDLDSPIIFTCRDGNRSAEAACTAVQLGYTNVKTYPGSWNDYAARKGLPEEPKPN